MPDPLPVHHFPVVIVPNLDARLPLRLLTSPTVERRLPLRSFTFPTRLFHVVAERGSPDPTGEKLVQAYPTESTMRVRKKAKAERMEFFIREIYKVLR